MSLGRRLGRRGAAAGRRSGPAGEPTWWDDADQAAAERPVLRRPDLGRGWVSTPMVNNAERLDPYGDDDASAQVRAARDRRVLTALDEGAAWRHRRDGVLLVARTEIFAESGEAASAHRRCWQDVGSDCLEAVWLQRWRERGVEPGWIEARWRSGASDPPDAAGDRRDVEVDVDWMVIEDHTGAAERDQVLAYDHLTVWLGRALVTLTLRRDHRHDVDETLDRALAAVRRWATSVPSRP